MRRESAETVTHLYHGPPPTYAVGMDDIDIGVQPHCPNDDIVMRDVPGGWLCPECEHMKQAHDVEMPPEFDGPDIHRR